MHIDTWNTVVAVATTPTLLVWGLAVNSTAVSLATASYIRTPLGAQTMIVATPAGGMADKSISVDFSGAPIVCESGRFAAITLRMPVGTATATEVIQGKVTVVGYYE